MNGFDRQSSGSPTPPQQRQSRNRCNHGNNMPFYDEATIQSNDATPIAWGSFDETETSQISGAANHFYLASPLIPMRSVSERASLSPNLALQRTSVYSTSAVSPQPRLYGVNAQPHQHSTTFIGEHFSPIPSASRASSPDTRHARRAATTQTTATLWDTSSFPRTFPESGVRSPASTGFVTQGHSHQTQSLSAQLFKTKLCPFMLRDSCPRDAYCTYAHTRDDLKQTPNLLKTKLCGNWQRNSCSDLECKFAHGREELRFTGHLYKTRLCYFWSMGGCNKGKFCRHAHGNRELAAALAGQYTADLNNGGGSVADAVARSRASTAAETKCQRNNVVPNRFGGRRAGSEHDWETQFPKAPSTPNPYYFSPTPVASSLDSSRRGSRQKIAAVEAEKEELNYSVRHSLPPPIAPWITGSNTTISQRINDAAAPMPPRRFPQRSAPPIRELASHDDDNNSTALIRYEQAPPTNDPFLDPMWLSPPSNKCIMDRDSLDKQQSSSTLLGLPDSTGSAQALNVLGVPILDSPREVLCQPGGFHRSHGRAGGDQNKENCINKTAGSGRDKLTEEQSVGGFRQMSSSFDQQVLYGTMRVGKDVVDRSSVTRTRTTSTGTQTTGATSTFATTGIPTTPTSTAASTTEFFFNCNDDIKDNEILVRKLEEPRAARPASKGSHTASTDIPETPLDLGNSLGREQVATATSGAQGIGSSQIDSRRQEGKSVVDAPELLSDFQEHSSSRKRTDDEDSAAYDNTTSTATPSDPLGGDVTSARANCFLSDRLLPSAARLASRDPDTVVVSSRQRHSISGALLPLRKTSSDALVDLCEWFLAPTLQQQKSRHHSAHEQQQDLQHNSAFMDIGDSFSSAVPSRHLRSTSDGLLDKEICYGETYYRTQHLMAPAEHGMFSTNNDNFLTSPEFMTVASDSTLLAAGSSEAPMLRTSRNYDPSSAAGNLVVRDMFTARSTEAPQAPELSVSITPRSPQGILKPLSGRLVRSRSSSSSSVNRTCFTRSRGSLAGSLASSGSSVDSDYSTAGDNTSNNVSTNPIHKNNKDTTPTITRQLQHHPSSEPGMDDQATTTITTTTSVNLLLDGDVNSGQQPEAPNCNPHPKFSLPLIKKPFGVDGSNSQTLGTLLNSLVSCASAEQNTLTAKGSLSADIEATLTRRAPAPALVGSNSLANLYSPALQTQIESLLLHHMNSTGAIPCPRHSSETNACHGDSTFSRSTQ